jgi:hypothetical protein
MDIPDIDYNNIFGAISKLQDKIIDTMRKYPDKLNLKNVSWFRQTDTDAVITVYQKSKFQKAYYNLDEEIEKSNEYSNLAKAIMSNADLNVLFSNTVGSYCQRPSHMYLKNIIFESLMYINDNIIDIEKYDKQKTANSLVKRLTSKTVTIFFATPFYGLNINNQIMIDDHCEIIKEKEHLTRLCLDWGLLLLSIPKSDSFAIFNNNLSYLISKIEVPIVIGRDLTKYEKDIVKKIGEKHKSIRETLKITLDLININIEAGYTISSSDNSSIYSIRSGQEGNNIAGLGVSRASINSHKLDQNEYNKSIKIIFDSLINPTSKRDQALRLACSRYSMAKHRDDIIDAFLDTMIAAEAFYLNDDSRNELGYRLSLRAAFWDDNVDFSKKDIMRLFKLAYDVRSSIAHGDAENNKKYAFREQQISTKELLEHIQSILRKAIIKSIFLYIENNNIPDWDEIIINN